jgi:hypothetical protein
VWFFQYPWVNVQFPGLGEGVGVGVGVGVAVGLGVGVAVGDGVGVAVGLGVGVAVGLGVGVAVGDGVGVGVGFGVGLGVGTGVGVGFGVGIGVGVGFGGHSASITSLLQCGSPEHRITSTDEQSLGRSLTVKGRPTVSFPTKNCSGLRAVPTAA